MHTITICFGTTPPPRMQSWQNKGSARDSLAKMLHVILVATCILWGRSEQYIHFLASNLFPSVWYPSCILRDMCVSKKHNGSLETCRRVRKRGGSLTSCGNVTSVRWWVSLVVGKLQELDEVPLTTIAPSKEMCDYKCARLFGDSFFV